MTETPINFSEEFEKVNLKLDSLIALMQAQVQLQRVGLLGPDRIFSFNHQGHTIKMHLPNAELDLIQKKIMETNNFFEARILNKLAERKLINSDSVAYDVGANIGNHTVFFAKVLGAKKVVSFEPQPHCFEVLKKNADLNGLTGVQPVQAMVGSEYGRGEIANFKGFNHGATELAQTKDGAIPMVSLDEFAESNGDTKIDFMKIDVEGLSLEVLKGAKRILKDMRPILTMELLARFNEVQPAIDFLKEYGYEAEKLTRFDYLFMPT